jgi:hypothetical protein
MSGSVAAPLTAFGGYCAVANDLANALSLLVKNPSPPAPPAFACGILAGHGTECLLKAILSRAGKSEAELSARSIRHDLDALWKEAALAEPSLGLPPDWVPVLARNWGKFQGAKPKHERTPPYRLRYPSDINGLVLRTWCRWPRI